MKHHFYLTYPCIVQLPTLLAELCKIDEMLGPPTQPSNGIIRHSSNEKSERVSIPWRQKWKLLLSPFYSMDGMNEHGLVVAIKRSPCRMGDYNPNLPVMNSSQLNRLILDNAVNVDQAVELLEGYN